MNKKFIRKLIKEGKIKEVDRSEIVIKEYQKKAENFIKSAKLLTKNNFLESAISDTYYAVYYTITAILYKIGIKCENHTAAIQLLEIININTKNIEELKEEKIKLQYYTTKEINKKTTEEKIRKAINIIEEIQIKTEEMDEITTNNIKKTILTTK